ncbi:DUF6207 family protein [Streptomyces sp. NPDC017966]|uniref:DUF6207 family protein n=1 Tax=Streptomyces sp. NPDC017966 TaxID=3365023 RepID=UPI00378D2173
MEAINDVHVHVPELGLVVVDVAAADDEIAFAFHAAVLLWQPHAHLSLGKLALGKWLLHDPSVSHAPNTSCW